MARPKCMLLDEPSLGLSPLLVREIFKIIKQINENEKTSILLVELNARMALKISEHAYVMETGRMVLDGPSAHLKDNEDIKEFYLGLSDVGKRKSYKDVKHYKRRKRWLSDPCSRFLSSESISIGKLFQAVNYPATSIISHPT